MSQFTVPSIDQVSAQNQEIFGQLKEKLSFVPNIYAYIGKHDTGLGDFLAFGNRKSTLSNREKEIVNLSVSELNGCEYCLSAHTAISKMNGFSEAEIIQIRSGNIQFDDKLKALGTFVKSVAENSGKVDEATKNAFFNAGYNEQDLIDVVLSIAEISVTNYIHNLTKIAVDFPLAQPLNELQQV
ncbi:carboxymuconolactone decarboxylase family protein [Flammeovirga yaeyamensis]|uniref:Carboxymuconolactone decarboxylase family protein n=1 Tax=Flammeovirga yaeyamensis TaxID=367791 RepID=A0AAX1N682_9BACT|nr:carboxymuconolactone decarboxylase family protein [Flammeovirga yaeyamensis]MBB3701005.1 putative peroxidase-related enzyme [Flammeovirga yaeyamensis]NMF38161.1 carboxymuconolactone decarboxylase family protein [Flammeovirga yaeyamensis]QWG01931.1 carboxymuconolactone decarboxylase family protein [Flammeovirga yaeyamensis]